ncbi:hypothetical protein CR513_46495, partial [Mucuna pruriens]
MKESKTIKEYKNELFDVATTLENIKDMCEIILIKSVTCIISTRAKKAYETRKEHGNSFFLAKLHNKKTRRMSRSKILEKVTKTITLNLFHHALIAKKKKKHPQKRRWWRPNTRCYKCGQLEYTEKMCKPHLQQGGSTLLKIN